MAKARIALRPAAKALTGLFQALADKDRKRACAFERRANRKLHAGKYRDVEQFRAEAEKALLVPTAIDTQKLLDFIKGLVEIMKELIPLLWREHHPAGGGSPPTLEEAYAAGVSAGATICPECEKIDEEDAYGAD